jgi:transposase
MPVGRPSSLTPEVQRKICEAVAAGNYYQAAAAYGGITYSCLLKWMQHGRKARRGKFFQFFRAVKKAEAEAEVRMVAQWQKQIPDNWPAARDFLARRFPKRWGPKDRHEVTGANGKAILIQTVGGVKDKREILEPSTNGHA